MTSVGGPSTGERGSATVHATFFIGLLTMVALVGAAVSALYVGQRRAASAADLAALAGASALQRGESGCAAAGSIAGVNGAELVGCNTTGDELTVEVTVAVPTLFRGTFGVRAEARAGPVQ